MNWQDFSSHRRLYVTVSLERFGSQVSGQVTRAHFAPQAVKLLRTVPGHSGMLPVVGSGQAELTNALQQLGEPRHHPLRWGSSGESWASDTKATPSLVTIEILQHSHDKHLNSGIQGSAFVSTPDSVWPKKNPWPPIESHGKERAIAFPYRVKMPEKNLQSLPLQSHKVLSKDIVTGDGNMSLSRGSRAASQYPELDFLEEHVLRGRNIKPKKKKLLQATLPICRLERRHEEIQTSKQEKMKSKRVNSKEAWIQLFPKKPFLGQKPKDLGPLLMEGTSLQHKKKSQALELSSKDHRLKSSPRLHRQNLQPAQDDSDKEATGKGSKTERRKLRTEWWDPTVWGDPVKLVEREQSLRKTCSEVHSDQRKLRFPMGRSSYKDIILTGRSSY
uniref:Uncharacterized protein n=1 Tax=Mus spicilegus TaxID=10103 RepID=A0A8C6H6E5_MUSSI